MDSNLETVATKDDSPRCSMCNQSMVKVEKHDFYRCVTASCQPRESLRRGIYDDIEADFDRDDW